LEEYDMNDCIERPVKEVRTIFEIPAENLAAFEAKIATLSKRSERLIGLPIRPIIFSTKTKTIDGVKRQVYEVLLTARTPKIDGWTFVARLDHANESGTLVRSVPNTGITIPDFYRTAPSYCQHCSTMRYRRDTFLVCSDEGEFKQVGSSCLKDFFGHDVEKVARMAEYLATANGFGRDAEIDYGVGNDLRWIDVQTYLAHVSRCIREYGFVSAKESRDDEFKESTRDAAYESMFPTIRGVRQTFPVIHPTADDIALAEQALEWAQGFLDLKGASEYEHNIAVIASSEMMETRSMGIAASILWAFLRSQGAKKAVAAPSKHVGTVGVRMDLEAVIEGVRTYESHFGAGYIYTFLAGDDVLIWFTAKQLGLHAGTKVSLRATVTKHDVYKGVKQTSINRCKVTPL
jgi:hypothetical protein